jgi:hypothetical protein
MSRAPTKREREVISFILSVGIECDEPITASDRERWQQREAGIRVGERCRCGTCPSVALEDEDGPVPPADTQRVLEVDCPGALVYLFINDDRPSYLELAPITDEVFDEFPAVEELTATRYE